jgi:hypothetical protein
VAGFPVFGTAQPTEEGFLRLLDKIPKVRIFSLFGSIFGGWRKSIRFMISFEILKQLKF